LPGDQPFSVTSAAAAVDAATTGHNVPQFANMHATSSNIPGSGGEQRQQQDPGLTRVPGPDVHDQGAQHPIAAASNNTGPARLLSRSQNHQQEQQLGLAGFTVAVSADEQLQQEVLGAAAAAGPCSPMHQVRAHLLLGSNSVPGLPSC
jgi:hypothetical protein